MSAFALAVRLPAQAADSAKTPPIQDNSFLVEEAYNQEAGVVQHIFAFALDRETHDSELDFTQEWPVRSVRHQLSYMVPILNAAPDQETAFGDLNVNYRYQLTGDASARVAVAPRLTIALPTGSWRTGAGTGALGVEAFLPASIVVSDAFVMHLNAGMRLTPSARNPLGERATIKKYAVGGSGVLLAAPRFNLMLETIWSREDEVLGPGMVAASNSWTVLPGARGAFNFSSGLQIVPGIGFPFGIGPSRGERSVFLYLSFEHAFSAEGRGK